MDMTRLGRHAWRWGLVALLCLVVAAPAAAQTTSASVFGSVTDSQGGALPGATVTLTSRTQGNATTVTTDATGRFVFPIVRPDAYALKVSMQGFKTVERTNVIVSANDKFSSGIISLPVGEMTEEVSVSGRVSELQAQSGERSFTLESEALKDIAANGRMLFNYALLVPGVVSQSNNAGEERGQVSSFTVNGQRPNSNNMTIDGVANIDTGDNGGNMATTNTEAVGEFKILTNAYQAEYGRAVGGQVQVVTKSGTQSFHGSGYWFGRRSGWNANTWTNKRAAAPPPVGNGALIEPAKSARNDKGYTFGGPIYIPGVFNQDKKKLFFFLSQEFEDRSDPAGERQARVPTALERAGDFSQSLDASGNPFPYIRDYTTGLPCNASDTRGCYQDGGVVGRIPQSRLYGPGVNALNLFPNPNFTAGSGINFTSQVPNESPRREDLIRLDFQATDNWRVTGRYMHTKENITQAYGTTWAGNGSDRLPMPVLFMHPGYNWMVSTTGILNSSTSLEVSVGTAHNSLDYVIQDANLFRGPAGLSAIPTLYPEAVASDYLPQMNFAGGRTGNAGQYNTNNGPFTNINQTWDVLANLTKIWGSHNAKFGVYYQSSYKPQRIFVPFNSTIDFTDNSSNPFDTGYSYANAATGVFNSFTQANKDLIPDWHYKNYEWYLQDNWKATSRLTLDYGVRFYYMTPQWDTSLQASNFLPDQYNQGSAATLYRPAIVNGVKVGIDPNTGQTVDARFIGRLTPGSDRFNGAFQAGQGISDTLQSGNAFRVSPRFGFTYDLTGQGRTIVRGGGGIFFDRPQGNQVFDLGGNAPGTLQSRLDYGTLQNLTAAGGDPDPTVGLSPSGYDFDPPKITAWNVGLQHKLMSKLIFDIAYVGSSSKKLLRQSQINAVPLGATFLPQNQDPTRSSSTPGGAALPNDFLRPFPGYGNIRMWDYTGWGNYHALQTSLNRRFDNGFMFTVFYVWSKTLTSNSTDFAAGLPSSDRNLIKQYDYSYADYDRPHNFVVNFVYQTPKKADGVLGVLVNEWQLSGVYRFSSGRPYTVGYSIPGIGNANLTGNDGNPGARIVVTCDPGKGSSSDPYVQLNTACFAPPQTGSVGLESARFFVHAPATNNLDLSLSKRITLHKEVKIEVRVDAFNALNHTQFTGVNSTANFASLTDPTITNLPYDSSGNLIRNNGFGTINGVASPRTIQLVTRLTF
jgi:outer membrane receptor protein involved in Fe transport